MFKEILWQKFVLIGCQSTELDNLVFVVMVIDLPWGQSKVQLQFRSRNPYTKSHSKSRSQLCCENASIIPKNLVFNNESENLNKSHC